MGEAVLAFDQATVTGWCFLSRSRKYQFGTLDFKKDTRGAVMSTAFDQFLGLVTLYNPDILLYEHPFVSNLRSAVLQFTFVGLIELIAWRRNIKVEALHPSSIKKIATGSGRSSKEEVLVAAQKRHPKIANDNEADAYWLVRAYRGGGST